VVLESPDRLTPVVAVVNTKVLLYRFMEHQEIKMYLRVIWVE